MPSNWIKLKQFPCGSFSDYILCNDRILIIKKEKGIFCYDKEEKKWIFNAIYSKSYNWRDLYNKAVIIGCNLFVVSPHMIYKMNVMNGECQRSVPNNIINGNNGIPNLLIHQNKMHSFMTSGGNFVHKVLSEDLEPNSDVNTHNIFGEYFNFYGMQSTQNNILIFGGWMRRNGANNHGPSDNIYEYNKNGGWRLKHTKLPQSIACFGYIATPSKKQHILIFGGRTATDITDEIWIYDTAKDIFVASGTKCPARVRFTAITQCNEKKDELATFGYIREMFDKNISFRHIQYPPVYLIKLFNSFYRKEYVHLMCNDNGDHWYTDIDKIYGNKHFISLPTTKSTQREKKERFIKIWEERKQNIARRRDREKYIDNKKRNDLIESMEDFFGCTICDRLFYTKRAALAHIDTSHMKVVSKTTHAVIPGKHILWEQYKSCSLFYCVPCADRRICVPFRYQWKVMDHGRKSHPTVYGKLVI